MGVLPWSMLDNFLVTHNNIFYFEFMDFSLKRLGWFGVYRPNLFKCKYIYDILEEDKFSILKIDTKDIPTSMLRKSLPTEKFKLCIYELSPYREFS